MTHFLIITLTISFLISLLLLTRILFTIYVNLQGAPYAKSRPDRLKNITKLLKHTNCNKVVDLGSGDGRVLIACISAGAKKGVGYEIDPLLVYFSKRNIKKAGLEKHITIYRKNFWNEDFTKNKTVIIYGAKHIMNRFETKLKKELKPGSSIISAYFKFPNHKPIAIEKDVYLYKT